MRRVGKKGVIDHGRRVFFHDKKVKTIRDNIASYAKMAKIGQETVRLAEAVISQGADVLWSKVTPNEMARVLYPGHDQSGCPLCGDACFVKHGANGWITHTDRNQWKVTCENCGAVFPSNDFPAFYQSGLDERGIFSYDRADRSLLVNTRYKDKPPDWFVDDGTGYVDHTGTRWSFVAYYNHFGTWLDLKNKAGLEDRSVTAAVTHLVEAAVITGEIRYALYGLLLLYKTAMVYPSMDLNVWMRIPGRPYRNTDGFSLQGKTIGCIWETYVARMLCYAADGLLPILQKNPKAVEDFFSSFISVSAQKIQDTIVNGIVRQVYEGLKNGSIFGNQGMHQSALAMAAVCMGPGEESDKWLQFLFRPGERLLKSDPIRGQVANVEGGNIFGLLIQKINRDGFGNEGSPMYNRLWLVELDRLADILSHMPGIERTSYDIRWHPVMKKMYLSYIPLHLDHDYVPKNGDYGKTGNPTKVFENDNMQKEEHLQKTLWNGMMAVSDQSMLDFINMSFPNAHKGDFGYLDCEDLKGAIQKLADAKKPSEPMHTKSHNLTGYGNALLRQKERYGCHMHMYYGSTAGHAHADKMNFEIIANGINCTPDLGYPEFAEKFPKRREWTSHTVSHNTVMVDQSRQQTTEHVGIVQGFEDAERIKYVDVDDPYAYAQTSLYRRAMCLVQIAPKKAYVVDFFRVAGGHTHHYGFHGAQARISCNLPRGKPHGF